MVTAEKTVVLGTEHGLVCVIIIIYGEKGVKKRVGDKDE